MSHMTCLAFDPVTTLVFAAFITLESNIFTIKLVLYSDLVDFNANVLELTVAYPSCV